MEALPALLTHVLAVDVVLTIASPVKNVVGHRRGPVSNSLARAEPVIRCTVKTG